jgi:uncharacterized membrane protein
MRSYFGAIFCLILVIVAIILGIYLPENKAMEIGLILFITGFGSAYILGLIQDLFK